MALSSFCGLLTLQVGAAMLAVIFFTVACIVLAVNVFDYYNDPNGWPISIVIVVVFVVLMIISGILMFSSAYKESRKLCIISVAVVFLVMAYWVVVSCFSFANQPRDLKNVCVRLRCAESFWLVNLRYRGNYAPGEATVTQTTTNVTNSTTPPPHLSRRKRVTDEESYGLEDHYHDLARVTRDSPRRTGMSRNIMHFPYLNLTITVPYHTTPKEPFHQVKRRPLPSEDENEAEEETEEPHHEDGETNRYKFGLPFVGAIILFVLNFLMFCFVILIMWSYGQELAWSDRYIEEHPSLLFEDLN